MTAKNISEHRCVSRHAIDEGGHLGHILRRGTCGVPLYPYFIPTLYTILRTCLLTQRTHLQSEFYILNFDIDLLLFIFQVIFQTLSVVKQG